MPATNKLSAQVPSFDFYATLEDECKIWGPRRAPPLPLTLEDYFHKKGPILRGDSAWHQAFWTTQSQILSQPELACAWLYLLSSFSGNATMGFSGLLLALSPDSLSEALLDPTAPARAFPQLAQQLRDMGARWTIPKDPARITWGKNAFLPKEDIVQSNQIYLESKAVELETLGSLSHFAGLTRMLLNQCAAEGIHPYQGHSHERIGTALKWLTVLQKAQVDPAILAPLDEVEGNARAVCLMGGKKLAQAFLKIYAHYPDSLRLFHRAVCQVYSQTGTQFKEALESLHAAQSDPTVPYSPATHPYHLKNTIQRMALNCLRRLKISQFFEDISDFVGPFTNQSFQMATISSGALDLALALAAFSSLPNQEGIRSQITHTAWIALWKAHAESPTPQHHKLLIEVSPPQCLDHEFFRTAYERFTPKQIADLEQWDLGRLLALVLDSADSDPDLAPEAPTVPRRRPSL